MTTKMTTNTFIVLPSRGDKSVPPNKGGRGEKKINPKNIIVNIVVM